jgi:hypothetical protein
MAIYKLFPIQDTTLYSIYPEMNTGLDEILEASLEVGNTGTPAPQASRFLIQFDSSEISTVLTTKISSSQWQSNLKCFVADVTALNSTTAIETYPISESWNMGTGRYEDSPEVQNGASWIWRDYQGGTQWTTSSFAVGSTGSYSSSVSPGGGTWYVTSSLSSSQTFGYYDDKNIDLNVTNIVRAWFSSSIPNNGFIVKQASEFIDNENTQPKMKYFSVDTHTIYPPCLEFKWNDTTFNTGSSTNTIITASQYVVTIGNNTNIFYPESINKFRVYSRPEYPARVFSTSSYFTQNYYLPTGSYYAIKDAYTNEYVIDFDTTYTKLSMDDISSYFTLYMDGLEPERYYKILIQTIIDGNTVVVSNDNYFKVVNG